MSILGRHGKPHYHIMDMGHAYNTVSDENLFDAYDHLLLFFSAEGNHMPLVRLAKWSLHTACMHTSCRLHDACTMHATIRGVTYEEQAALLQKMHDTDVVWD